MAKRKESSGEQLLIDLDRRRGSELDNLKRIRLGDPLTRHLLRSIDDVIGSRRTYWDMTLEELMDIAEMKKTTFYDRLSKLKTLSLISVTELNQANRKRLRISHANISELVRDQARATFPGTEPVRQANNSVRQANNSVRQANYSVRQANYTTTRTNTYHTPPHEHEGGGGENFISRKKINGAVINAELIRSLVDAGLDHPTTPLETAFARGVRECELFALIAYFDSHKKKHGWKPEALRYRVLHAAPGLPTERGWPNPDPKAVRDQQRLAAAQQATSANREQAEQREAESRTIQTSLDNLEKEHGTEFANLAKPELLALAHQSGIPGIKSYITPDGVSNRSVRTVLLRQFAKDKSAHTSDREIAHAN